MLGNPEISMIQWMKIKMTEELYECKGCDYDYKEDCNEGCRKL